MLELPFFRNDGDRCAQVAMRVVVNYFLRRDLELDELDRLSGRSAGCWTWNTQTAMALHRLGLEVAYFTREPLESFLQGEEFLVAHFGEAVARTMLSRSDWPRAQQSFREVLELGLCTPRSLEVEDLEAALERGVVPIVLVDYNVLMERGGDYHGHCVVVTGIDAHTVWYHESGPEAPAPHRPIQKRRFVTAWKAPGTDHDAILVSGTRKLA